MKISLRRLFQNLAFCAGLTVSIAQASSHDFPPDPIWNETFSTGCFHDDASLLTGRTGCNFSSPSQVRTRRNSARPVQPTKAPPQQANSGSLLFRFDWLLQSASQTKSAKKWSSLLRWTARMVPIFRDSLSVQNSLLVARPEDALPPRPAAETADPIARLSRNAEGLKLAGRAFDIGSVIALDRHLVQKLVSGQKSLFVSSSPRLDAGKGPRPIEVVPEVASESQLAWLPGPIPASFPAQRSFMRAAELFVQIASDLAVAKENLACAWTSAVYETNSFARHTESAARTWVGLKRVMAHEVTNALVSTFSTPRRPLYQSPQFVVHHLSHDERIMLTLEQAQRWNLIRSKATQVRIQSILEQVSLERIGNSLNRFQSQISLSLRLADRISKLFLKQVRVSSQPISDSQRNVF